MSHSALEQVVAARLALARALWKETLVDAALFRQWIVNLGTRTAAGRMAYLLAELHQRLGAMGLVKDEQFSFPITQSKLAEALGLSVVHVNRFLQSFRADGVFDFRKQVVTLHDIETIVELGGFDDVGLNDDSA